MTMQQMIFTAVAILLTATASVQIAHAQEKPVCQYADSDPDGDGYGWENRTSCVMTEQSTLQSPMQCIDDDGDGWGWNGREVCRVDLAECQDSDPVGDGWGWNGVTSCELPVYAAPFSELAVLRTENRTLFGESLAAATLVCSIGDSFQVFDLFENGTVIYSGPDYRPHSGIWTTGFSDSDGILNIFTIDSAGATFRDRVLMEPDRVTLRAAVVSASTDDCYWAT